MGDRNVMRKPEGEEATMKYRDGMNDHEVRWMTAMDDNDIDYEMENEWTRMENEIRYEFERMKKEDDDTRYEN